MAHVIVLKQPQLHRPIWIGSFVGWADAQQGASRAVRYLIRRLAAEKFAEIDPEEFYDFTLVRPTIYYDAAGRRQLRWPSNELYSWKHPSGGQDLIIFLGTEPNLKWRTFTQTLLSTVQAYDMQMVVNLGSLLDTIPHTRDPVVTGAVSREELKERLRGLPIRTSNYQGPGGITSAFMDACMKAGLDYVSIWAHAPHYVQHSPNYKVSKALVSQVNRMFGLHVPLEDLERRGAEFEAEVTKAVAGNAEVSAYVKQLEQQFDTATGRQDLPTPQAAIEEIEKFLRSDRPGNSPSPN